MDPDQTAPARAGAVLSGSTLFDKEASKAFSRRLEQMLVTYLVPFLATLCTEGVETTDTVS